VVARQSSPGPSIRDGRAFGVAVPAARRPAAEAVMAQAARTLRERLREC
jgi:hypothetical protein